MKIANQVTCLQTVKRESGKCKSGHFSTKKWKVKVKSVNQYNCPQRVKSKSENCKSGHLSTNSEKWKWEINQVTCPQTVKSERKMQIRSLFPKQWKVDFHFSENCKSGHLSTNNEKWKEKFKKWVICLQTMKSESENKVAALLV